MPKLVRAYTGPQCPFCEAALPDEKLRTGLIACDACHNTFEGTAFQPPLRPAPVAQTVAGAGPEGANACSTHAGNAAVTSCDRCGLFICSLCEMSVGAGSFCPACFDRIRAEGMLPEVATSYRDYASMARLSIFGGILMWFLSPIFAALAIYWSFKGWKQRREEGRSRWGVLIFGLIAVAQFVGSLLLFGFLFWGIFNAAKGTP